MPLKTKLLVSGVQSLTEGRYFSAVEATYLGFNLNPESPYFIHPQEAKEVIGWLSGPVMIGELEMLAIEVINELVELAGLDAIQVDYEVDYRKLSPAIDTLIRRVKMAEVDEHKLRAILKKESAHTKAFVLDFSELSVDWASLQKEAVFTVDLLRELAEQYPIFLGIDYAADSVLEVLEAIPLLGIMLRSGNELALGMQTFDDVGPIIDVLEEEMA